MEADVTDRGAVDAALDEVRAQLGPIEIMVTAAGLDSFEPFTDITIESWERILAVNLTGTFHCLQAAVPDMLAARWGRMVTISSSSAQSGAPRMAHYVASKGGVIGLTKALALELAPHGITVNTIPPGMIDTPMLRRAEAGGDVGKIEKVAARMIPVGRAGTPEDIAAVVRVPLLRRSGLHHRPGDRRQRRHGPVNDTEDGAAWQSPKRAPKQYPKPPEGTWTEHYPELGTAPVSYESSISPEFYELEREAIFKRAWLNVGRVEQLRRKGGFFTKELAVARTSLIVVRGMDDEIRAFHNVCRHRGNKLVWTDHPRRGDRVEPAGSSPASTTAGSTISTAGCSFILQEGEFFGIDKADYGLVPVHCEVWQGFIFVNLAEQPTQTLTEFLGPMITAIDYPFEKLTERYYYRGDIRSNWKVFLDAFQEFYHPPILHGHQNPVMSKPEYQQQGFYTMHFQIDGPHRVGSTSGGAGGLLPPEMYNPIERVMRSGLFGPWDVSEIVTDKLPPGLNPGNKKHWGLDSFQIFPNFAIVFWETGWYLTYHYWPTAHNRLLFEANAYFTPPRNVRERLAQQLGIATIKEYALQDCGTLEATQMGLESRVVSTFPLGDQELMCRHLNKVVNDWVRDYQRSRAEV